VGTVTIGTTAGTSWSMRDAVGNYTTDLNGSTSSTAAGTTFTDADNIWGNGAVSDRASAGVDAHYGAGKTFDYYKNIQGRNGIWNTGVGARSRVHYGTNYVNAFWDGSQMTYGDGASNTHPLVELDVAGHEMSHGVTENTAALVYTGDAGGLNEATSDIFGTAVEWYANNASDTPDYLIGEEININGNGTPLRYMDKPSKDGGSRDCWSSTLGGLDPHYSSGPLNHWFYLASEGSGAKGHQRRLLQQPDLQRLDRDRHRSRRGREDLVPHPVDVPHVEQQLCGSPHGSHQVRQGPVWRRIHPVRGHRVVVLGDRRASRRRDLWHDTAATGQPAAQPRLRVRCGQLDQLRRHDHQQRKPSGTCGHLEDVARRQRRHNH